MCSEQSGKYWGPGRSGEPGKLGWFVQAQLPEASNVKLKALDGVSCKLLKKAEITVVVVALN